MDRWLDRLHERRLEAAIDAASVVERTPARSAQRRRSARAVVALVDAEIQRAEARLHELLAQTTTTKEEP